MAEDQREKRDKYAPGDDGPVGFNGGVARRVRRRFPPVSDLYA
jgi:hypothetical protein